MMVGWLFVGGIALWLCLVALVLALCRAADEQRERREAWREERLRAMDNRERGENDELEHLWEAS